MADRSTVFWVVSAIQPTHLMVVRPPRRASLDRRPHWRNRKCASAPTCGRAGRAWESGVAYVDSTNTLHHWLTGSSTVTAGRARSRHGVMPLRNAAHRLWGMSSPKSELRLKPGVPGGRDTGTVTPWRDAPAGDSRISEPSHILERANYYPHLLL